MGKKDFKTAIRTQNIENIANSYITAAAEPTEAQAAANTAEPTEPTEPRTQRSLKTKNNKNKTVSFRLTEQQYNKLLEQAEAKGCNSISSYIVSLID